MGGTGRNGHGASIYPANIGTVAQRAYHDNLGCNEELALAIDEAVQSNRQDDWRSNSFKIKKVKLTVRNVLAERRATTSDLPIVKQTTDEKGSYIVGGQPDDLDTLTDRVMEITINQREY